MNGSIRIGFGYDVHAFSAGRKLMLGGIEIPHEKGLLGHSDADVLIHSIADAFLGALALGDIGKFFPDSDPKYKDMDSKVLLSRVYKLITDKGYELGNIDSTVVMEEPKLAPYLESMRESIAQILDVDIEQISIKATTSEKLGFAGRGEGAAAYATILINKRHS